MSRAADLRKPEAKDWVLGLPAAMNATSGLPSHTPSFLDSYISGLHHLEPTWQCFVQIMRQSMQRDCSDEDSRQMNERTKETTHRDGKIGLPHAQLSIVRALIRSL